VELRHQHLNRQWPADLGPIEVDPPKLRDCLNQLLLNAIKFTPDGGTITLAAVRVGAKVEIRVEDTGDGMDSAALAHLFEPFFTGFDVSKHSSGKFEYGRKGIGLGLSVVKRFVELHGGVVTGQSQLGNGSTFTITLPAKAAAAATVVGAAGSSMASGTSSN
jgi:signal transduction histidine kinase